MHVRIVSFMLLALGSAGSVNAYERSAREHPFKALASAPLQAEVSPMDFVLVGTIETSAGFEALIERTDGRVARMRVGDLFMEGHVVADVWARGARVKTPQRWVELSLRPQVEATQ